MGRNKKQTPNPYCEWVVDEEYGSWGTACDDAFCFLEDGPAENRYKFCPSCGKPIKVVKS